MYHLWCQKHAQWDYYRISHSGPPVPGCYNGEIQSFFAKSGPYVFPLDAYGDLLQSVGAIQTVPLERSQKVHHLLQLPLTPLYLI